MDRRCVRRAERARSGARRPTPPTTPAPSRTLRSGDFQGRFSTRNVVCERRRGLRAPRRRVLPGSVLEGDGGLRHVRWNGWSRWKGCERGVEWRGGGVHVDAGRAPRLARGRRRGDGRASALRRAAPRIAGGQCARACASGHSAERRALRVASRSRALPDAGLSVGPRFGVAPYPAPRARRLARSQEPHAQVQRLPRCASSRSARDHGRGPRPCRHHANACAATPSGVTVNRGKWRQRPRGRYRTARSCDAGRSVGRPRGRHGAARSIRRDGLARAGAHALYCFSVL